MKYRRNNFFVIAIMLMVMLLFPIIINISKQEGFEGVFSEEISTNLSSVTGNETGRIYRWGLKRGKLGEPPEVGVEEAKVLLKYGGMYLGDSTKKTIYLTFDEGYENGYTNKILDVLKANKVQGIFFITGDYLKRNSDLVRRMVEEGHEVGNHTVNHPSLATISTSRIEKEIIDLDSAFYEKFRKSMKMVRPPMGEYNVSSMEVTKSLSYTTVMWSFAYKDWERNVVKGPDFAYNMVSKNLHNGAIILLHAVSKDNTDALDRIIKGSRQQGYEFGTADQLLHRNISKTSGGVMYEE